MSDNERMDRAERIREMRGGQRENDGTDDNEGGATEDTSGATDGEGAAGDADGADPADGPNGSVGEMATAAIESVSGTDASIPTTEKLEAAMDRTMDQAESGSAAVTPDSPETPDEPADQESTPSETAGPAGVADEATTHETERRVLEFTLSGERYCLDIEYIEEIVKQETITRVPNTPDFVDGVVDLRGQITTILNPKVTIGKDDQTPGDLIVVFDAEAFEDQGAIGWVVDDVRQVSPVSDDQVNDPPMGEDYINGVIDREDDEEFVIWTTPDLALDEAE